MEKRLNWIDSSKGILILLVVLGHITVYANAYHINNSIFNEIGNSYGLYSPFYMAAFFMITGFVSNFDKPYRVFLSSNIKSLLFPSITLIFLSVFLNYLFLGEIIFQEAIEFKFIIRQISEYWFLVALFFSKQIYFLLRFYVRSTYIKIAILVLLYVIGIQLGISKSTQNYYWFQQAFVFCFFIFLGEQYKRIRLVKQKMLHSIYLIVCIICYAVIISYMNYHGYNIPSVARHFPHNNRDIFIFFILAVCGSITFIDIFKKIGYLTILSYIGKHTLIIYCMHFCFLNIYFKVFSESMTIHGHHFAPVYILFSFISSISSSLIVGELLNCKYLRWILGKSNNNTNKK